MKVTQIIRSKLSEGSCKTEKERDSDPKIMLSGKILGAFLKSSHLSFEILILFFVITLFITNGMLLFCFSVCSNELIRKLSP